MPYYTYNSNLTDRNKFTSTVETTFGTKRYFSSLDTEVYFGSTQIDEMVAIDFTVSEPKLPIYGFNSFYPNRMISGRRTIQGTFAINFTHVLYLLKILNSIEDSVMKASYLNSNETTLDYESLTYRCEGEDSTGLGIGNNAIFSKMFDITISYGYGKTEGMQTYNSSYQTLVGVQIVDYRQALDTEGNPILDMYSFIAKDIRYNETINEEKKKEEKKETSTTPSNPVQNPSPGQGEKEDPVITEPDYIIANMSMKNEVDEIMSKCQNTELPGFLINPTINYVMDGSSNHQIRLYLDCMNNSTDTFTDVAMTIFDQANGINITFPMKDIKKHSYVTYELVESNKAIGDLLYRLYLHDKENYQAQCIVEFNAKINNETIKITYPTLLFPRELY